MTTDTYILENKIESSNATKPMLVEGSIVKKAYEIELDGGDKDEAFFNIVSYQLADQIDEWIMEIENK